ncbi:MAG: transcriptional repressor NrdR [Nitrospinae bacterium]|nr:transcriptional repressor NrdR [Nitrospinota bacterium]
MRCPYCENEDTRVVDTRTMNEGSVIRRKRVCGECNEKFNTLESVEFHYPTVVKKDNTRVEFDLNKVTSGLRKACQKRIISENKIEEMAKNISEEIRSQPDKEVKTEFIGNLVMKYLKQTDHVAYVRFASVYRSFKDLNEFMDELKGLLDKR